VLFLHGWPPCYAGVTEPDYFLRWQHFAALLAKSGYIVAVPSYEAPHAAEANHPTIARAMSVIDWVRGLRVDSVHPGAATARRLDALTSPRWENADWVHPRATAIVGHSFGATLAARIAHARPSISSYVSLSGPFALATDLGPILQSIQARKLFMWAPQAAAEDLDQNGIWGGLPQPKHAAFLPQFALGGLGHFDYIAGPSRSRAQCGEDTGTCLNLRPIAANLTALFIARHTPVGASPGIPVSLIPPNVTPTPSQKTFGRALLSYTRPNRICPITVRWETPEESGARILERPE
jgi:pimeloyl-ACP methyl ester carboxylesterase